MQSSAKRVMSVFSLVMLNIIAVDSLRSLPFGAVYGFSIVFFYLLAGIVFFIPTALVSAELATGWSKNGGVYIWVREAFGVKWGMVVIWLQWIYNICWYPTIMSLLAATLAYMINPALVQDKAYMLTVVMILFLGTTVINCFGMQVSSRVTNIAAMLGSIVPMVMISVLGCIWVSDGKQVNVDFSWHSFFPHTASIGSLVLLTNVLYSLVGMEMSAIHAQDVKNPQRSYPRALVWSTIIILATLIGGSLAIAIVIPQNQIQLMTGMLELFYTFFAAYHITWMNSIIAVCIILGGLGGVAAWVLGPSKGLLIAAQDGALPSWLQKSNRFQAPIAILGAQAVLFVLICGVFLLMPTVNSSYWILSNITAILSLLAYVFMFAAAVRLRYSHPQIERSYKIPFGNIGMWAVAVIGSLACIITIIIGFWPPEGVDVGNVWHYEAYLVGGVALFCGIPFVIYGCRKPSWGKNSEAHR
ncbi:MAG: Amino acid transporter [Gammaproteobacteria bacterium]|jgi:putative glutamate/gamma-aminobutyrate antiporter|nr:Amino acid transporter [Gammaproteobacteria bacterium]